MFTTSKNYGNEFVNKTTIIDSCKKFEDLFYNIRKIIGCNFELCVNNSKQFSKKTTIIIKFQDILKAFNITNIKIIKSLEDKMQLNDNTKNIEFGGKTKLYEYSQNLNSELTSGLVYQTKLIWMLIFCMVILFASQVMLICRSSKGHTHITKTDRELKQLSRGRTYSTEKNDDMKRSLSENTLLIIDGTTSV